MTMSTRRTRQDQDGQQAMLVQLGPQAQVQRQEARGPRRRQVVEEQQLVQEVFAAFTAKGLVRRCKVVGDVNGVSGAGRGGGEG